MRLKNILICVKDIEASKRFYKELFGLSVILDGDCNVMLTEGLVLQEKSTWEQELNQKVIFESHTTELYFEENNMDEFVEKVKQYIPKIKIVTPYEELEWGQKILRLYDLDGNLIEVRSRI